MGNIIETMIPVKRTGFEKFIEEDNSIADFINQAIEKYVKEVDLIHYTSLFQYFKKKKLYKGKIENFLKFLLKFRQNNDLRKTHESNMWEGVELHNYILNGKLILTLKHQYSNNSEMFSEYLHTILIRHSVSFYYE